MALDHADDGQMHAATGATRRRLAIALALAAATAVLEIAGSLRTGSLALLADAVHVLGDAGALTLALGAVWSPRARTRCAGPSVTTAPRCWRRRSTGSRCSPSPPS